MQFLQMLLHLDQNLGHAVAAFGPLIYAVLFAIVFCEMAFLPLFFLPGVPLLFICGSFCAVDSINILVLIPLLIAAAISGSIINYGIGRAIGKKVYTHNYRWLDKDALNRSHAFYEEKGALTFLLSPYIPVVRTFAPFIGGVSAMTFPKFVLWSGCGAVVWVASLVTGGYFLGNTPLFRDHFGAFVLLGLTIGIGALLAGATARWYRRRKAAAMPHPAD